MPNAEEIWVLEDSVTVGRNAKQDSQRCPAPSGAQRQLVPSLQRKIKPFLGLGVGGDSSASQALAFRSLDGFVYQAELTIGPSHEVSRSPWE